MLKPRPKISFKIFYRLSYENSQQCFALIDLTEHIPELMCLASPIITPATPYETSRTDAALRNSECGNCCFIGSYCFDGVFTKTPSPSACYFKRTSLSKPVAPNFPRFINLSLLAGFLVLLPAF